MKTCEGCKHYQPSRLYGDGCYREKRFASGRVIQPTPYIGFASDFGASPHTLYEGRADGDTCGADRIHWEAV